MNRLSALTPFLLAGIFLILRFTPAEAAPPLTSLYSFSALSTTSPQTNRDGARPYAGLVQGPGDSFYGSAPYGGANSDGTLFKITSAGVLTPLVEFNGTNGANPGAIFAIGPDGDFYGSTYRGGAHGSGTLFKLAPDGTLTTLYSFSALNPAGFNSDGAQPEAPLVAVGGGNFFGTTVYGGTDGEGTVFKLTTDGTASGTTLTTLDSFTDTGGPNPGAYPYGGLVLTNNGLYGTTSQGGVNDTGTVYKITSVGAFTSVYSFPPVTSNKNTDGSHPYCTLVQGNDFDLYGTTSQGGANGIGTVFKVATNGTASGTTLTTLVTFDTMNGAGPNAGVIVGPDGDFYGTTVSGGLNNTGTIYKVTSMGDLMTLYSFSPVTTTYPYMNGDGGYPIAALTLGNDKNFYGTTYSGGTNGEGSVYRLNPPPPMGMLAGGAVLTTMATTVNLTHEGSADWAHFARGRYTGYDHKASGGKITNYTAVGSGAVSVNTNDLLTCAWTDGVPTASNTSKSAVQVSGIGDGFQIIAPADPMTRTLTVYVGGANSGGKLVADLSDKSAPDYVQTRAVTAGPYDVVYTLTYHSVMPGQKLYVKWVGSVGTGSVSLAAATLH